ncbi:MAG: dihydropteroate synthase, partial [Bacteroidota bacterium]
GVEENVRLLREHNEFIDLGVPLLVGASRKSFIGRLLGGLPPDERLNGTLAAHAVAALRGATIIRVHDVRAAREFFTIFAELIGSGTDSV